MGGYEKRFLFVFCFLGRVGSQINCQLETHDSLSTAAYSVNIRLKKQTNKQTKACFTMKLGKGL